VNVGDESYGVPLTFNRAEYGELAEKDGMDAVSDFFAKYLGDVSDELGDDDLSALFDAWTRARVALGAPDAGEPSASPSS
jgi:hypothetical protein